jgi:acyl carrier protein
MISQSRGNVEDNVVAGEVIEEGILHFDATARRRERMRSKANSEPAPVASTAKHLQAPPKASPAPTIAPGTSHDSWKSRVQQAQPVAAFAKPAEVAPPVELATPVLTTPVSSTAISTISEEEYRSFLVGFVVEQTGYPEDIVELDSDLEADLGIDSIKVAQMMGELQERFELDLAKIQIKSLDELRTLRQIIQVLPKSTDFVTQKLATPTIAQTPPPAAVAQPVVSASPIAKVSNPATAPGLGDEALRTEMTKFLIEFVVEQTGYPEDIVELDADLEADLGIDSIKVAQMMGELNEHFGLNVSSLRSKTSDDFKTLRMIVDTVLAAGVTGVAADVKGLGNDVKGAGPGATVMPQSSPSIQRSIEQPTSTVVAPVRNGSAGNRSPQALQKFLVDFVVEQTGYPEDIVELDSDLEADLGIDSIKIAQMLGELKEHFDLDVSDFGVKSMDEFKTLRAIINKIAQ